MHSSFVALRIESTIQSTGYYSDKPEIVPAISCSCPIILGGFIVYYLWWLANHVSRAGLAPTHAFTGGDILHWEGTGHTSAQCPGGHSTLG